MNESDLEIPGGPPMADVVGHWGLSLKKIHGDTPLAGSPERSLARAVIEDGQGRRFVLEKIAPGTLRRKRAIAATLELLALRGLAGVHPCLRNRAGEFITEAAGGFWQISPFIDGVELQRPGYTLDGWRGMALARFFVDLRKKSRGIPPGDSSGPFSITIFIRDLMGKMRRHDEGVARAVEPACRCLEDRIFAAHDGLAIAFCHGDCHSLNVIWGRDDIRGVIDWEFSGYKPEVYDAALLLGCIGMEDPESLAGPMALEFLGEMRAAAVIGQAGWDVFPEFVLALRFAWLSDWLRKRDAEMVELEKDYIRLLLKHLEDLRQAWGL